MFRADAPVQRRQPQFPPHVHAPTSECKISETVQKELSLNNKRLLLNLKDVTEINRDEEDKRYAAYLPVIQYHTRYSAVYTFIMNHDIDISYFVWNILYLKFSFTVHYRPNLPNEYFFLKPWMLTLSLLWHKFRAWSKARGKNGRGEHSWCPCSTFPGRSRTSGEPRLGKGPCILMREWTRTSSQNLIYSFFNSNCYILLEKYSWSLLGELTERKGYFFGKWEGYHILSTCSNAVIWQNTHGLS